MFSGYIFDVEGTLVDSVPYNVRSFQEALEKASLTVPYATLQLYSGLDGDQTLQIIAPDFNETQRKQIIIAHATIYETKYLYSVKALGDVREVFETLTQNGGRIAERQPGWNAARAFPASLCNSLRGAAKRDNPSEP